MTASRKETVLSAINNSQVALTKALELKSNGDYDIREIATALHHLSFAVQELGHALADDGRADDLPIQT